MTPIELLCHPAIPTPFPWVDASQALWAHASLGPLYFHLGKSGKETEVGDIGELFCVL